MCEAITGISAAAWAAMAVSTAGTAYAASEQRRAANKKPEAPPAPPTPQADAYLAPDANDTAGNTTLKSLRINAKAVPGSGLAIRSKSMGG